VELNKYKQIRKFLELVIMGEVDLVELFCKDRMPEFLREKGFLSKNEVEFTPRVLAKMPYYHKLEYSYLLSLPLSCFTNAYLKKVKRYIASLTQEKDSLRGLKEREMWREDLSKLEKLIEDQETSQVAPPIYLRLRRLKRELFSQAD